MVAGLIVKVPQVLRVVVGGAVVDGVVPHALGAANGVAPGGGLVGKVHWAGGQI